MQKEIASKSVTNVLTGHAVMAYRDAGACAEEHDQFTLTALDMLALLDEDGPRIGSWKNADDIDRLVRELDVALNGKDAAKQARLCDIVSQVKGTVYRLVRADVYISQTDVENFLDAYTRQIRRAGAMKNNTLQDRHNRHAAKLAEEFTRYFPQVLKDETQETRS
jgi:hypothetical protein